ncbi:MAG: hypothetical protein AAGF82_20935, partial [Pseudomonadota bacterium]
MLEKGSTPFAAAAKRFARSAACAFFMVCPVAFTTSAAVHAQTAEAPMPPRVKPDPNAPSAAGSDQIINLLDREPEPLFSDVEMPYTAPSRSLATGFSEGLDQGALYLMAKLTRDSN